MKDSSITSPNFGFLTCHNDALLRLAAFAERYVFEDPNTALIKIRQLAEALAKGVAAQVGIAFGPEDKFRDIERILRDRGLLDQSLHQIMRSVRMAGNEAVHELAGSRREAFHQLKLVRQLAVWFHKTVTGNTKFKAGPFTPPPNPADADETLKNELQQLRESLANKEAELEGTQLQADELAARVAESKANAEAAYANEQAAMELAAETEESAAKRIKEYEQLLAEVAKEQAKKTSAEQDKVVATSQKSATDLDLDEFDTRKLIDDQLRQAGWVVDTNTIRHSKGSRPQKNKNIAISEWPTSSGPADYVLFVGLIPVAVVEAKRKNVDVAGALTQAKRYSENYVLSEDEASPGGPWEKYHIPFLFSTNGRGYLKQLKTKSGVWFLDARRNTNHPRPLVSWYSPEGLKQLLSQDTNEAEQKLESESSDYLPLRFYQHEAVRAVEQAVIDGEREMLVAMATGTGKTRTCIGICYRLIKSKRFRRILFLVDRTSLGQQTADAMRDVKIENNQTFADIYDVKELGDLSPDSDTKFHIATIQGMVHRLLESEESGGGLSVDQYDCIVVDECHRGYNLDQELSENELRFRDEADYISKYSRVIEYFDAVKIGLTATPAIHTLEIFGGESQMPVYQYSYRQAVLDGFLVDHEPPLQIQTKLGTEGIKWEVNEQVFDGQLTELLGQITDEIWGVAA